MTVRVRCETCLGLGYRGRHTPRGWRILPCRQCGGRGDRPATDKQRPHWPSTDTAEPKRD